MTTDHSRRQGEFIDIAEQCNNMTGDRSAGLTDSDYYSSSRSDGDRRNNNNNNNNNRNNNYYNNNNRRNADENDGGRRNVNREFSVLRQDFGGNNNYNNNNNRGGSADYNNDRGNGGDRDSNVPSCDYQQQHYPGNNNGGRPKTQRPGSNTYYPSMDYDYTRQSNFGNRPPPNVRRYRRKAAAATTGGNKLLGNNRFRNVTKIISSSTKGSILDKMDACTIHCVFNQLEMLNSNSRPDKSSIVNIMTNQIKDVELKEFIQDSIDECFDTLELDSHDNKCEFSKNFAVCMENKAQRNCDDWDENGSTNKINSAQNENNQKDKRKG